MFFHTKMKEIFFQKIKYYFQFQIAKKTLIADSQAQVKPIRPSAKWSKLLLPKNLSFIFLLDTILTILDLDPDPYFQYGSGSRGAISIRIHMDPDPKHWVYHKLPTFHVLNQ